eukprot:scaffold3299_cov116-Isochrysis_galbana.AAC.13
MIDGLLGRLVVAKVERPNHNLLLTGGVEAELGAVRVRCRCPMRLPRGHVGLERGRQLGKGGVGGALGLERDKDLPGDSAIHETDTRRAKLEARAPRTVQIPAPALRRGEAGVPGDGVHGPVRCDLMRVVEAAVGCVGHIFGHAPGGRAKRLMALVGLGVVPPKVARRRVGQVRAVVEHGHAHAVDRLGVHLAGRQFLFADLERFERRARCVRLDAV